MECVFLKRPSLYLRGEPDHKASRAVILALCNNVQSYKQGLDSEGNMGHLAILCSSVIFCK